MHEVYNPRLSLTAEIASAETEILAEAQRIVDETTSLYNVAPISVVLRDTADVAGEWLLATRTVILRTSTLADAAWRAVFAHEVGHALRGDGHDALTDEQSQQCELDATALGVEVLVRIVGLSLREAVECCVDAIRGLKERIETREVKLLPGDPDPDLMIRDLLGRFPEVSEPLDVAAGEGVGLHVGE